MSQDYPVLSVSQYVHLINETLQTVSFAEVVIEGEISDFHIAQQKWVSFDLKDEKEQVILKCFLTVWQLTVPLQDGRKVHVRGFPKVYERFGTLKLQVQEISLVGEGALRQAYEQLKKKLEQEGLFALSHKRSIPRFPSRIGLITSKEAAAYGDFLRVLQNRWGGVEVWHEHVSVQGRGAVEDILRAFSFFNGLSVQERPEVLVLTRGGGGLEDLHAFNDEQVARVVFQSSIPVVCAVGHERDESLCDFVCDVRASTPSNAAELVVPDRREILYELQTMKEYIQEQLRQELQRKSHLLETFAHSMRFVLERQQERIRFFQEHLFLKFSMWFVSLQERITLCVRLLQQTDPKRIMLRGYALVRSQGKIVRDVAYLNTGREVRVELAKGFFDAEVLRINKK